MILERIEKFLSSDLLRESYKNLMGQNSQKELYKQEAYDMLQRSYAKIGGIKGSGFNSPDDMVRNIPFWKLGFSGGRFVAAIYYKDKNGRKIVAAATDGSDEGKAYLKMMIRDEYATERSFGEKSGPLLSFVKKLFGGDLSSIAIPVTTVKKLLPDDDIIPVDDYYYQRNIGGELYTKIMLGNPSAPRIY